MSEADGAGDGDGKSPEKAPQQNQVHELLTSPTFPNRPYWKCWRAAIGKQRSRK